MKKCPYCAEDIQDEAIKCKHCGEWFATLQDSKRAGDEQDAVRQVRKPQPSLEDEKPDALDAREDTNHHDISAAMPLLKKPRKYGWGWCLLLGILGMLGGPTAKHSLAFEQAWLTVLWCNLGFVLIGIYFWLRRKLIAKWEYARWMPGLVAGVCIYVIALVIFGLMAILDRYLASRNLYSNIASVHATYKDQMEVFKQQDAKLQAKLIYEPHTVADVKKNVKVIDEMLQHSNAKRAFALRALNDLKKALHGKTNTTHNKPWAKMFLGKLS